MAARLAESSSEWRPWYCPEPACDGKPHGEWGFRHARADQRPPSDPDWFTWLMLGGRGAGKTRNGSEYAHRLAGHFERGALIAPTAADARDVMVEGESGLLATARPGARPDYEPSKRRLTWPNGAQATLFSADEPDRLRGPQHAWAWGDEPCAWRMLQSSWDNLLLGLRLGSRPRVMLTTTPRPSKWLTTLLARPDTRLARASTYANLDNLAPQFAATVLSRYEGTRLGRQEIEAEVLTDIVGALWNWTMIEAANRPAAVPDLFRVVVAIDPAVTSGEESDETGIVVAGMGGERRSPTFYVLADLSARLTPDGMAERAVSAYDEFAADAIIGETNNGGDFIERVIRTRSRTARYRGVRASRGKQTRAEPVAALYEQGRVHHTALMPELEDQLTSWTPESAVSPDRLDALVWALTDLAGHRTGMASVA